MKNKVFAAIAAGSLSMYGSAGFWCNNGNQTINPILFVSILAAIVLAPIAVIISAYLWTRRMPQQRVGGKGVLWLLISASCFVGFLLWLTCGEKILIGKPFALISGLLMACSAAALVYAVTCFTLTVFKKNRRNVVCQDCSDD